MSSEWRKASLGSGKDALDLPGERRMRLERISCPDHRADGVGCLRSKPVGVLVCKIGW